MPPDLTPAEVVAWLRATGVWQADQAADLIERLTTEQERLRAALKPFAWFAGKWLDSWSDDWTIDRKSSLNDTIARPTLGDCRAALAALQDDKR